MRCLSPSGKRKATVWGTGEVLEYGVRTQAGSQSLGRMMRTFSVGQAGLGCHSPCSEGHRDIQKWKRLYVILEPKWGERGMCAE